jgi:CheY-like chemotaxis protein
VLLADDVEPFLELEKTFLQLEDIELLVARNGLAALAASRRARPKLILLDIYRPGMDGTEVCREVKADQQLRATPALMVTSGDRDDERARCEEAGCDGIVSKPIKRHLFFAAVRGHLTVAERGAPRVPARLRVRFGQDGGRILTDYTMKSAPAASSSRRHRSARSVSRS